MGQTLFAVQSANRAADACGGKARLAEVVREQLQHLLCGRLVSLATPMATPPLLTKSPRIPLPHGLPNHSFCMPDASIPPEEVELKVGGLDGLYNFGPSFVALTTRNFHRQLVNW